MAGSVEIMTGMVESVEMMAQMVKRDRVVMRMD